MIRRKSTLDHAERAKRTKFMQIFTILDLCLQLTSDDRLIIRNQIKNGDEQLSQRIYKCKRDKNYHGLQIYLRKIIKDIKDNDKFGLGLSKRLNKSKPPISAKTTKNQNDNSLYNSAQSSLPQTSSIEKQKQSTIAQLKKTQLQKPQKNQINRDRSQIYKQSCQLIYRGNTSKQLQPQIIQPTLLANSKKLFANQLPFDEQNIKQLLRTKMMQKKAMKILPQLPTAISCQLINQNRVSLKQNMTHNNQHQNKLVRNSYSKDKFYKNKQNKSGIDFQYGQFHKRIKKVIQDAH